MNILNRLMRQRQCGVTRACSSYRLAVSLFALSSISATPFITSAIPNSPAASLSWTAPTLPAQLPTGDGTSIVSVACPSATLCLAFDAKGDLLTSTDPTGGGQTWRVTEFGTRDGADVDGVTCPSAEYCAAVDSTGDFFYTTNPGAGPSSWSEESIDASPLIDVSCPSPTFCAVASSTGHMLVSSDPADPTTWSSAIASTAFQVTNAVSCPNASLCLALDGFGHLIVSTQPDGRNTDWHKYTVPTLSKANALTCPSTTLCIAVGSGVIATSDPALSVTSWTDSAETSSAALTAISCSSQPLFCFASGEMYGNGVVAISGAPTGAWKTLSVDTGRKLNGIACVSTSTCVAVDGDGDIVSSGAPTGGVSGWQTSGADGASLSAVACPSASFCMAVGGGEYPGEVGFDMSTTTPGTTDEWISSVTGTDAMSAISCPAAALCVGGGYDYVATAVPEAALVLSTFPKTPSPDWIGVPTLGNTTSVTGLSCPAVSLCVATDSSGNVLLSRRPERSADPWRVESFNTAGLSEFTGLSCPSTTFCAAVGESQTTNSEGQTETFDDFIYTASPTGGQSGWHIVPLTTGRTLTGVSCPSVSLCAVTGSGGNLYWTTTPAIGSSWKSAQISPTSPLSAVSCPTVSFCAASNTAGQVLTSATPTAPGSWASDQIDATAINDVACAASSLCVAVDGRGFAIIGRPA